MKNRYLASLVKNGLLGGWLLLDGQAVTYRTNKLTVAPQLRNLQLPLSQIQTVRPGKAGTVQLFLADGQCWTFLVFGRRRFLRDLGQLGKF